MNIHSTLRTTLAPARWIGVLALSVACALSAACSAPSPSPAAATDGAGLPAACETYLQTYDACTRRLMPQNADLAAARVAGSRASLERIEDRAQLRDVCTNGTAQLRASCQ